MQEYAGKRRSAAEGGVSRITVSLPRHVFRIIESRRLEAGVARSEYVEKVLVDHIEGQKEAEMDARGHLSEKIENSQEYLEELILNHVERIVKMVYRDHVASEALLIRAAGDEESRQAMKRKAAQIIGSETKSEKRRREDEG